MTTTEPVTVAKFGQRPLHSLTEQELDQIRIGMEQHFDQEFQSLKALELPGAPPVFVIVIDGHRITFSRDLTVESVWEVLSGFISIP